MRPSHGTRPKRRPVRPGDLGGIDSLDRVMWTGSSELGRPAGKPLRLRAVMSDADLFSFQFMDRESATGRISGGGPRP
jgi:hypothetical protein